MKELNRDHISQLCVQLLVRYYLFIWLEQSMLTNISVKIHNVNMLDLSRSLTPAVPQQVTETVALQYQIYKYTILKQTEYMKQHVHLKMKRFKSSSASLCFHINNNNLKQSCSIRERRRKLKLLTHLWKTRNPKYPGDWRFFMCAHLRSGWVNESLWDDL